MYMMKPLAVGGNVLPLTAERKEEMTVSVAEPTLKAVDVVFGGEKQSAQLQTGPTAPAPGFGLPREAEAMAKRGC